MIDKNNARILTGRLLSRISYRTIGIQPLPGFSISYKPGKFVIHTILYTNPVITKATLFWLFPLLLSHYFHMYNEDIESWLQKCRVQDRKAQKFVYDSFYGYVFNLVKRYCHSSDEAKECCNDVFFKVFTKIETYKSGSHFKSWLSQIAVRTAIDRYRSQQSYTEVIAKQDLPEKPSRADLQILDKMEVDEKIKMIQRLTPGYRTVFNLYVFEQYTHEEIAEALNISVGTSKSNLSKARQQLTAMLNQYSIID